LFLCALLASSVASVAAADSIEIVSAGATTITGSGSGIRPRFPLTGGILLPLVG
jgi:hypothetical protein